MTAGIPDHLFTRGPLPMTKEEVRVLTICRARLKPGLVVWDIGAGTGSLTVEAAIRTPGGRVFAVEQKEEGAGLIGENCRRFHVDNVTVITGRAPAVLTGLPAPDRVLVGGSGGELEDILAECALRMKPGGIVVVNALTVATLGRSLAILGDAPFTALDGLQAQVSRLDRLGGEWFFRAQNAVWIISAERGD